MSWREGKLTSNNVAGSSHNPLQSFVVASSAVFQTRRDAAGQMLLHSAGYRCQWGWGWGCVFSALSAEIHHQLIVLSMLSERWFSWQPFSQGIHLLSVCLSIVVSDQAYHRCVVIQFDDDVWSCVWLYSRVCTGSTGVGWGPALRSTSVEDQGDEVLLPILTSACQEVQDPAAQRSV